MPLCSEALEVKETFNLLSRHLVLRPLVFLKLLRFKGIQPFVFPDASPHTSTSTPCNRFDLLKFCCINYIKYQQFH